ncbi:MAG: two-component sensor histidine kinase [Clostridiales Family XIII bacterium]|jgi:signal transduction histidine kinase|nr:two-component sensor histidine kinase [Clostridiales Family XIII bacterium]
MKAPLFRQLSLVVVTVVLLAILAICILSNVLLDKRFEAYAREQQALRAADIAENLSMLYYPVTDQWDVDAIHALGMYSLTDGFILVVRDKDGAVVWDAQNHDMARCAQIMEGIAARMESHGKPGDFETQTLPILQSKGEVGSVSVTSYGPFFFSEADATLLSTLNKILLLVGVIALAGAAFSASLLARRITSSLAAQQALRKQLTSDMAHELRTPLAALSVQIESMAEGAVDATPERLAACHQEIKRLTGLVEGLERLEEAAEGKAALRRAGTDLAALARTVCTAYESEAAAKGIRIAAPAARVPVPAFVDADVLAGVLSNLLSNAVKYTPEGGRVEVAVHAGAAAATVTVSDTGPGVPEEELPRIFERLYRADKSRNRKTGGTGLGLAVAKEAVEAHGGRITAKNNPGGGMTFTISLPPG